MLSPFFSRIFRKDVKKNQSSANPENDNPPVNSQLVELNGTVKTVVEQLIRANDETTPEKKEKKALEISGVRAVWAAAIAGLIAIGASSVDSHRQYAALQRQSDIIEGGERPWIKVTIPPVDLQWVAPGLAGNKNWQGLMWVNINATNVGHIPALNLSGVALILTPNKDIEQEQKRICAPFGKSNTGGKIVFPGDTVDAGEAIFGHTGASIDGPDLHGPNSPMIDGKKNAMINLYGCADYIYGTPPSHHQTFFSYLVARRVKTERPPYYIMEGFSAGVDVAASEIVLKPTNGLNDAN